MIGKRTMPYLIMLAVLFAFTAVAYAEPAEAITLSINGEELIFTEADGFGVPFIDANSRTQVPIRKPLEAIGADVDYIEATGEILIEKDGLVIRFDEDRSMYVNGYLRYNNDARATVVSGRSYIPIRFVFEELGYTVDWDASKFHISVNKRADTAVRDPEVPEGWGADGALAIMFYNAEIGLSLPGTAINGEPDTEKAESFYFGSIFIYNRENRDIILEPFDIELQVFKISDIGEELVVHETLPTAKGLIPEGCAMISADNIRYPGNLAPGTYHVKYTCPDVIRFSYADDEKGNIRYLNTEEHAMRMPFESILVLE